MPSQLKRSTADASAMSKPHIQKEFAPLTKDEVEAVAVAKLIGSDERSVVGWVYRWNTGSLGVLWRNGPMRVVNCCPELTDVEQREIDFHGLCQICSSGSGHT